MAGKWMSGAVKKPGALRRTLGVKKGKRISGSKLRTALHSKDPMTRKRAVLARTFRKFRRK